MGSTMPNDLVFALHGFLGQATDWQVIKKFIQASPNIQFEALDLFHEDSLPIQEFEDYTEQLAEEIDALIDDQPSEVGQKIFLGYSLGGRLGLHLLQQDPEQFDHYIFVSTNPGLDENKSNEKNERLMTDMKWAQQISESNWSEFIAAWNAQAVFENSNDEPIRHYGDYDLDKLKRALVMWSLSQQEDFRDLIQEFQHKITWVVGEKDLKYSQMAEEMKQKKVLLEYKKISSGHRIGLDQIFEIVKIITDSFR
jgi:2-succinyl-6-hydroxy-2,4-cyclohexadiene-1-carboxylate synthase